MAKDPFDLMKSTGNDIVRSVQWGSKIGTAFSAWNYKRQLESDGYDPITIEAAVEALKAGRDPKGILQQAQRAYALRAKQDEMRCNPPPIHGSARWAQRDDLIKAKLLRPLDGRSLTLGSHHGQPVTWDGESHLLTVAPTRTGKSTMQIIPNLLNYQGSVVVLDPKGELYQHTAKWRQAHVGPVYVINPFGVPNVPASHHFNPLDMVTDTESAVALAEILYPRTFEKSQEFFENEAIGFLAAVLEFTARYAPSSHRNLATIRKTLASIDSQFYGLVKAMSQPHMPEAVQNAARNFMTKSKDTGKPRLADSLNTHLRIWDSPALKGMSTHSDFTFQSLKDQPATVYLVLPFDKIAPYSTFVRTLLAAALDAMLQNPAIPKIPVLFILDEFLALDRDERFISALRTHASAGMRLWFFLQDLPTLEQKYPQTWKSFLQVETKTFFGTDDPYTADLISKYLGDQTIAYETPNMSASTTGGASASASYSISENLHLSARKLLTPDEVIGLLRGSGEARKAVHFLRSVPPLQTDLTPWFLDDTLKARV